MLPSGHFTVYGAATGWAEVSAEVDVALDSDGCHPVGETVALTLTDPA